MKVLRCISHSKHTRKLMGEKLGAGKRLNLRVRGPGEKPSWGETTSSGTWGSHHGHLISLQG